MSRHLLFPAHALRRLGALLLATALLLSLAPGAAADEVAPSTRASLEGDRSPDGWFRGPVEVHLDATDAGGDVVAATEYRVDEGEWQVLAGGAETIFDGTQASLDRWRMAGPGEFVLLPDGTMTTTGGMGMLWYPVEYGDIALELQFRDAKPPVFGGSNAGVFVRFPDVDDAASRTPD
ncbi:MAG: family 16 glycoside hydrolase, partial [Actinomycetota bacterium]